MPPSKPISACWRWPDKLGDRHKEAEALYQIGFGFHCAHEFEQALEFSHQAQALAAEIGNQNILAASLFVIAFVHAVTGKLDEATHGIDRSATGQQGGRRDRP